MSPNKVTVSFTLNPALGGAEEFSVGLIENSTEMSSKGMLPRWATPTKVTTVHAAQAATDKYSGGGATTCVSEWEAFITIGHGPFRVSPVPIKDRMVDLSMALAMMLDG